MLADNIRLKNINHITYNVKDKEAARKWYQDIRGGGQSPKMVNSDHLYWLQVPSGAMRHSSENADENAEPAQQTDVEGEEREGE